MTSSSPTLYFAERNPGVRGRLGIRRVRGPQVARVQELRERKNCGRVERNVRADGDAAGGAAHRAVVQLLPEDLPAGNARLQNSLFCFKWRRQWLGAPRELFIRDLNNPVKL